ncbi:MAG: NADP(H)-dependent aldo-keto reductase [Alphaproteobacteria bacterium]
MRTRKLGNSDIDVSVICLGTMTFGEQTNLEESFKQMDYALDHGVNFWDTAEMYSVPPRAETYGLTETYIGKWLAQNQEKRDKIVLATKVAGASTRLNYMRPHLDPSGTKLDRQSVMEAADASLKRLNTDYIDLYQVHWPARNTNMFDRLSYVHLENEVATPILETLDALGDLVKQGKVRTIGISNETPWGVMEYLNLAKEHNLPRVQSIQNPYNLLKRDFEIGLAEMACRADIGLLAYSPLAMGVLSGKYLNDARPAGSRMALFGQYFPRYLSERAQQETRKYVELAREYGLDPAMMANSYVNDRPFVTSNIIGATTFDQLVVAVESEKLRLPDDLLRKLEAIHNANPIGY